MKRGLVAVLVVLAAVTLVGCQPGREGSRCSPNDAWGQGDGWVLRCVHRRWTRVITIAEYLRILQEREAAQGAPSVPTTAAPAQRLRLVIDKPGPLPDWGPEHTVPVPRVSGVVFFPLSGGRDPGCRANLISQDLRHSWEYLPYQGEAADPTLGRWRVDSGEVVVELPVGLNCASLPAYMYFNGAATDAPAAAAGRGNGAPAGLGPHFVVLPMS